jgi:hypothetical protein
MLLAVIAVKCSEKTAREAEFTAEILAFTATATAKYSEQQPAKTARNSRK